MICVYKAGLILSPGEVVSWTRHMCKLTSTRHKNILLRVAHGDVFSNERLNRFRLRDSPGCSNCNEPYESPLHRVVECPNARRSWEILDETKVRIGLSRLTDHSLENILGTKDTLTKLELTLQAELLLRITSTSEGYDPSQLVKASVKLIYHSENLNPDIRERLRREIEQN